MRTFVVITPTETKLLDLTTNLDPWALEKELDTYHMVIYDGTVMNRKMYPCVPITKDEYLMLLLGQVNERLCKIVAKRSKEVDDKYYNMDMYWFRREDDKDVFEKFFRQCKMLDEKKNVRRKDNVENT